MPIYNHHPGYAEARRIVEEQSYQDDLRLIDDLYGRDGLQFGDGADAVKAEALRQLEMDYRDEENEAATFWVDVYRAMKEQR